MLKKEMIAMLLAGGQGSRLGVLTKNVAKPAVSFGGKYRIIDFPLSNCVNSGIDTVGVLTQYQPLRLNSHIGIGIPWDLDKNHGGVTILSPHETIEGSDWYSGTANAIFQNIDYIEMYDPEYVLILSGDHIYKMDYDEMLNFHKKSGADATVAVRTVPWEEASRFGLVIADESGRVSDFEEKPANPRSNLASMGIYIFSWKVLKNVLIELKNQPNCDFGMHVLPHLKNNGSRLFSYRFDEYWKDVGTLSSYWQANMELIDIVPEFNLYEDFWKIYTKCDNIRPQYIGYDADVKRSLVSDASDIYGKVYNSCIGYGVKIEEGAVVEDSIIMSGTVVKSGAHLRKTIVAENCIIGKNVETGLFDYAESVYDKKVYADDLVTIGERSVIPDNIKIGKNTAIMGETSSSDYENGILESGHAVIREGGAL